MGLSAEDQKRLILDILKAHQSDQTTRRNELEQLNRLTAQLLNQTHSETPVQHLNALQTYCEQESINADGASMTSSEELDSLIQAFETT
ncbi:YtzH-like family protein [Pullulanibacillus sp. KACC 23026]|uniref:YtzH-like family protein n=1 Tax=Pullulanibacillus sp. KACC 23026 TaxID=3028315 RepID=UPI0023B1261B|nr:YtzH-like family protein [Pullulanibacillus sp. KACC 23026]WEG13858.1 YtzH-like family protein [Pullulanibacillus sp. KACC 23026]